MVVVDRLADRPGGGEVERRPAHRLVRPVRDLPLVDRGVGVGVDGEEVAEDVTAALAGQVEVGVVGQVDDGGVVRGGAVVDGQLPRRRQGVGDAHVQCAGEALVAVRAVQAQQDAVRDLLGLPHPVGEAVRAAVQGDAVAGGGERVVRAVEGDPAAGDPVGVPADGGAVVPGRAEYVRQLVAAEQELGPDAGPVGGPQGVQGRAEGEHARLVRAGHQRPAFDRGAGAGVVERLAAHECPRLRRVVAPGVRTRCGRGDLVLYVRPVRRHDLLLRGRRGAPDGDPASRSVRV